MIEEKGIVSYNLATKLAILQSVPASLNTYRRSSKYIQFRDAKFTHHPLRILSSLFTATNLPPIVRPPLNSILKGQLPINSRRGAHKLRGI